MTRAHLWHMLDDTVAHMYQQGCVASVEAALRAADLPVEDEVGLAAGVMVLYNLLFSMAAAAGELDIQAKEAELR